MRWGGGGDFAFINRDHITIHRERNISGASSDVNFVSCDKNIFDQAAVIIFCLRICDLDRVYYMYFVFTHIPGEKVALGCSSFTVLPFVTCVTSVQRS